MCYINKWNWNLVQKKGFYSVYFLVPKWDGSSHQILYLRRLYKFLKSFCFACCMWPMFFGQLQKGIGFLSVDLTWQMHYQRSDWHASQAVFKIQFQEQELSVKFRSFQTITFMTINSVSICASLSPSQTTDILNLLAQFRLGVSLQCRGFLRLIRMLTAASSVIPQYPCRGRNSPSDPCKYGTTFCGWIHLVIGGL